MSTPRAGRRRSQQEITAEQFLRRLTALASPEEAGRDRGSLAADETDEFIGVRMGAIFKLARECMNMPPPEIERLLVKG